MLARYYLSKGHIARVATGLVGDVANTRGRSLSSVCAGRPWEGAAGSGPTPLPGSTDDLLDSCRLAAVSMPGDTLREARAFLALLAPIQLLNGQHYFPAPRGSPESGRRSMPVQAIAGPLAETYLRGTWNRHQG